MAWFCLKSDIQASERKAAKLRIKGVYAVPPSGVSSFTKIIGRGAVSVLPLPKSRSKAIAISSEKLQYGRDLIKTVEVTRGGREVLVVYNSGAICPLLPADRRPTAKCGQSTQGATAPLTGTGCHEGVQDRYCKEFVQLPQISAPDLSD